MAGPDGHRYTVTLLQEPFDALQTVVFQREGWTGTAAVPADVTPMNLVRDLLEEALEMAKDPR